MSDLKASLARGVDGVAPPPQGFERMLRRRDRKRRNRRVGAGVVGLGIAVAIVAGAVMASRSSPDTIPIQPVPSPGGGETTFGDLYQVSTERERAVVPLLVAPGDQWGPERSPVDERIAYVSLLKGAVPQVYVLDEDGTQRQLTFFERGAQDPTWSPDGSRIAFASRGAKGDIYVVDADGGEPRLVGGTARADYGPDWSPDGSSIIFDTTYPNVIYAVDASGGRAIPLTGTDDDYYPAFSPDGAWIAYTHYEDTGDQMNDEEDLWLMRADGSQAHLIADGGQRVGSSAWSPGGYQIGFGITDRPSVVAVATGKVRPLLGMDFIQGQSFPLGQERWRWIGDTGAWSWDDRGIVTASVRGRE